MATGQIEFAWPAPGVGTGGVAGGAVDTVTGNICCALVPQEFAAVTVMFPFTAVPDVETVILGVPCPAVIIQPGGTLQL